MARITVNETGSQPLVLLTTDVANSNVSNGYIAGANVLSVTCLQDITITASTGIYSWVDFCSKDINKLPTPADNEISMNVVIDPTVYFGNTSNAATSASGRGLANLSQNKVPVTFMVVWNYNSNVAAITNGNITTTSNNNIYYSMGNGYVTQLAPVASPDAPVWITPAVVAVDGTMITTVAA